MSWIPGATISEEHQQWNRKRPEDRPRFLGTVSGGATPAYYVPGDHRVETGDLDRNGDLERDPDGESWTLEAEEEVGEFLERIGEERGWDSLSEWAREHLEHEDEATS